MRVRSAMKWVVAFAGLALASGPAGAEPGVASTEPPASDAQVGFERSATLSPKEKLAEADRILARMDLAVTGVRRLVEEARRQRDVVKTLCLNDKLGQLDVTQKSVRDRRTQLQEAVTRGDSELTNHAFTILVVLRQRTDQVVAEANQCIGEESAFVGDTRTTVKIDPQIPPEETPYPPTDPALVIGPPQCTSCTL